MTASGCHPPFTATKMKKHLLYYLFFFFSFPVWGQHHDNTLVFGYAGGHFSPNDDGFGLNILSYTNGNLSISDNQTSPLDIYITNASISDSTGNLLFYSNGIHIEDADFKPMPNGRNFDPQWTDDTGYSLYQGALILPYPGYRGRYLYFYSTIGYLDSITLGGNYSVCTTLSYAIVDMNARNGKGTVLNRKVSVLKDTLDLGKLTTVRHANGRDWWMPVFENNSNRFYIFLIDPSGVRLHHTQTIGDTIIDGVGQAVFSPDGNRYVAHSNIGINNMYHFIHTYHFDRCTGILSKPQSMHYKIYGWGGVAISPNSKWLYAAIQDTLYQMDLNAANIYQSREVVAIRKKWWVDPFPTPMFACFLAPDNKIYIPTANGSRTLHVIHDPDTYGLCQYQNHGIRLRCYNSGSLPNIPQYRLGPLDGSPCDTLGLNNDPRAWYRYGQDSLNALSVAFHDLSYHEPATWEWDFGDGSPLLKGVRHPEHEYPAAGRYEACLTVRNANGSHTHCKTLYLGVSAQDNPVLQAQVVVSPNPFTDRLAIALSTPDLRRPVFRLFDVTGRVVRTERLEYGINEIETGELPKGAYFWVVEAGGERVKTGKIVKL
jgi:hypothetical protein